MVPVSEFYSRLLPHIQGCPEPLAMQGLVDAAILFCEHSLIITRLLEPAVLQANVPDYSLDTPDQMHISQILNVWVNDTLLVPVAKEHATQRSSQQGTPARYSGSQMEDGFMLSLAPIPDAPGTLRVRAALKPSRKATRLPDELFDDWVPAVVEQALSILLDYPGTNFYDPTRAMAMRQRAHVAAMAARGEMLRGRVQSSLTATMRKF